MRSNQLSYIAEHAKNTHRFREDIIPYFKLFVKQKITYSTKKCYIMQCGITLKDNAAESVNLLQADRTEVG